MIEKTYLEATKGIDEDLLNDSAAWYNYVVNLPPAQQIVYTVMLFHSEVENGGFHQYFFNAFGQFAFLTLKVLKLLGATQRFALLEKALLEVNSENIPEEDLRRLIVNRELKKISDFDRNVLNYLESLDKQYYSIQDEDIHELLENYLAKN
jgi:hypothetical protein